MRQGIAAKYAPHQLYEVRYRKNGSERIKLGRRVRCMEVGRFERATDETYGIHLGSFHSSLLTRDCPAALTIVQTSHPTESPPRVVGTEAPARQLTNLAVVGPAASPRSSLSSGLASTATRARPANAPPRGTRRLRTSGARGGGQARSFGAADLATVRATCHPPRRRGRGLRTADGRRSLGQAAE